MDRLLDEGRSGPFYLRQPALAQMVVEAIHHNASVLAHYALHAYVVMPNHVHLLISLVRDRPEFGRIRLYIERNPVRAGLVQEASEYPWSSAGWTTGGSPADQGSALR